METEEIKILIIDEQEDKNAQWRLEILSRYEAERLASSDVRKELDRISPDLIFLRGGAEDDSDLIQLMQSIQPLATIIYITDEQDFQLLRNVTRAGAADFFVMPDEASLLSGRLDGIVKSAEERKLQEKETAVSVQNFRRGRGQILAFYSGKGGSGRSIISSVFSQTMKLESTAQVLLMDLNLQFGGTETFLSIESNRSIADLQPVIDELNESHIRNVAQKEKFSQLEVLLSPRDAETAETLTDEFVERLLRTARRSYDFVIVDLPTVMDEVTYTALEEADAIYYVMTPDTPSIQILKQAEKLFSRLGINVKGRMSLIVNGISRENEINANDIKNTIDYPLEAKIRRDFKGVQTAVNQGEPLRKSQNEKKLSAFSKDVRKWVLGKLK
ncbi:AAA family ATPase [Bacillus marinisedimentorum]|uniref:AAA family ATPase n=1 Tax=Bacillus marinisedimentorum TaxID=1821260 RepID=UPI000872371D|nr:AAA family ATPase [Bacillus marinisedimentorum]